MFSVGTSEIMVIMVIALLVYGKRLPEVARQLGRTMAEFKRGIAGIQREFSDELMREDRPQPRPAPAPMALAVAQSAPLPVPGAEAVPPADKELTPPADPSPPPEARS